MAGWEPLHSIGNLPTLCKIADKPMYNINWAALFRFKPFAAQIMTPSPPCFAVMTAIDNAGKTPAREARDLDLIYPFKFMHMIYLSIIYYLFLLSIIIISIVRIDLWRLNVLNSMSGSPGQPKLQASIIICPDQQCSTRIFFSCCRVLTQIDIPEAKIDDQLIIGYSPRNGIIADRHRRLRSRQ